MALSGYLPLTLQTGAEISATPTTACRCSWPTGTVDDVVVVERGEGGAGMCSWRLGYPVDWHHYLMAHEVCMEEIADLNAWLVQRLGRLNPWCGHDSGIDVSQFLTFTGTVSSST